MTGATPSDDSGIDYERLYDFRFRHIDQESRQAVWNEIARYLYRVLGDPQRVLEPGAGRREFISAIPATERWTIDMVDHAGAADPDIHTIIGDARTVELPERYFDGVFVSNLLEHFTAQDDVGAFLKHLRKAMAPGGRIAVLGPNFRYCAREYFDCADHTLALTHLAVEEHLYAAGFEIERSKPRFLPYSFRGRLPAGPKLVRSYLAFPPAWRLLGKQFLVVGTNG